MSSGKPSNTGKKSNGSKRHSSPRSPSPSLGGKAEESERRRLQRFVEIVRSQMIRRK